MMPLLGGPAVAKLSTFSDRIGKTHGIRLRISPPINANSSACHTPITTPPAVGMAAPCAALIR